MELFLLFILVSILLQNSLSFVQVDCYSGAVVCVGLRSLVPGPDELCRLGNQGETFTDGRHREEWREKEVSGEW